jgi:hypothetical protein
MLKAIQDNPGEYPHLEIVNGEVLNRKTKKLVLLKKQQALDHIYQYLDYRQNQ